MTNETALAKTSADGVFSGIQAFEQAQRMAQCLAQSTMVPKDYQGQQGLANCMIAMEVAGRMKISPLVVMQNMVPIHGRPTWSSSFLIGTINASGRFSPLRFHFDNEDNPTSCYAEAKDLASGDILKGQKVTLEMAKKEGWTSRAGSKWPTMPGQMLTYRAASFWVRVYCPEISLGLVTQEEALDAAVETVTVKEIPAVPEPIQATPTSDHVEEGLRQIPVLSSVTELEDAFFYTNQLLNDGIIDKEGADRLRAACDQRRQELDSTKQQPAQ
jgi:hypothetical protein